MTRALFGIVPCLVAACLLGAGYARAAPWGEGSRAFSFAVIGDMPYNRGDAGRMERLMDAINAREPAFVIHVGDIKGGGQRCDDATIRRELGRLGRIATPVFYTPGDNEWTDCGRASNGGYNPFERLDFLRSVAYADPPAAERQSATRPENALWTRDGVVFATLHIVGSNNARGLSGDEADARYEARARDNLAWLNRAFARAGRADARGLALAVHANPFVGIPFISGFAGFLDALRDNLRDFRKPVLLIHGDSHTFRVDQPWRNDDDRTFDNFTRLETFGDRDVHATLVLVDPDDPGVFAFAPLYAPGGRAWVDDE